MIDARLYRILHGIMFADNYPGYRPTVREIPNGDGKVDAEKNFAHIADKYLTPEYKLNYPVPAAILNNVLHEAHLLSLTVSQALGVPLAFRPKAEYCAVRLLDYPPGAVSNLHTDFNLFTLMLYRSAPEKFVARHAHEFTPRQESRFLTARKLNAQLHLGELAEMLGLGPATPHEVIASEAPQHSVVFFAIPDWHAALPTHQTVGEWLAERMSRSRTEAKS